MQIQKQQYGAQAGLHLREPRVGRFRMRALNAGRVR
jgi:hypothetical protein